MNQPRKVERTATGLSIDWDDGHRSTLGALHLRLGCKCATCEDEWTGQRRVSSATVPPEVQLLDLKPVGRYGLQLYWSDSHSTGIYTFDRLRELCECSACAASRR